MRHLRRLAAVSVVMWLLDLEWRDCRNRAGIFGLQQEVSALRERLQQRHEYEQHVAHICHEASTWQTGSSSVDSSPAYGCDGSQNAKSVVDSVSTS